MTIKATILACGAAFFGLLTAYLAWIATHGGNGSHGMAAFFAGAVTVAFLCSAAASQ